MRRLRWNICDNCMIAVLAAALLCGCGNVADLSGEGSGSAAEGGEVSAEELLEPVVGVPAYDTADYRCLYDAEIYPAVVCPEVEEYSYETKQAFGGYGRLPGEQVQTGDVLLYGDTGDIDERIEELQKTIEKEETAYGESRADYEQDLTKARETEALLGTEYIAALGNGPQEDSPYYEGFARAVMPIEGAYKKAELARRRIEEQISELEKSHELTAAHNRKLLDLLTAERNDVVVTALHTGTVVAAGLYTTGESIEQGTRVMAAADLSTRRLQTEFIDQSILQKAASIYALADGVRYEVTPEIIDKTEYQRLLAKNGAVYSTFYPKEGESLSLGQYAVIVVVREEKEDVLCVPSDAVSKEGASYYVNLYEDGTTTRTEVKIGMRDGMYTEILTGISAGDKVLSDGAVSAGKTVQRLSKGSVSGQFSETGYLFYPTSEWVKNPAETGTCYLKELCVSDYEQVEEGQVLARLEVIPDAVETGRIEREIQRERERLAELEEEKSKDYSGEINYTRERAIRARNKAIKELEEQLTKLREYTGVVELRAPYAGMIMRTTEREAGDLISSREALAELCSYSRCYILVEDDGGRLSYGNEVSVTYTDADAVKQTISGQVVTVNEMCLSSGLSNGYALIAIRPEELDGLVRAGSGRTGDSGWYRNRFTVETEVRTMENVVLVPKSAVKEKNGSYYVRAKSDEGVSYVSFVPGGSDLANYWAAVGLEEGMEICLD